jgi:LPXTG-site transpeptidase (sortase) family protein
MIFVIPVSIVSFNFASDMVHKAQKTLTFSYCDVEIDNSDVELSSQKDGQTTINNVDLMKKYGNIVCENAGMNTDVYYGINRVSLRNGCASSAENSLPGQGGCVKVTGYYSTAMKALKNVEIGDIITYSTTYGVFTYKVYNVTTCDSFSKLSLSNDEELVLSCYSSNDIFANYSDEKLFVQAKLVSGPTVQGGVTNE